jgi:hypothetical protein
MSEPLSLMLPAVGSISRRTVRPTVVLPQPDSPTSPSVSPGRIEKLTPSTANTRPAARRNIPFWIVKCFLRSVTSRTGAASAGRCVDDRAPARSAIAGSEEFLRVPARHSGLSTFI